MTTLGVNEPLDDAIANSLAISDWTESMRQTKKVVIRALRDADPRVRIEDTSYFNHSFIPDLILHWGTSEPVERNLHLRFDAGLDFVVSDLDLLKSSHPILLGLDPRYGTDRQVDAATLSERAAASDFLLAKPATVESLTPSGSPSLADLLSGAILRGGKGALSDTQVHHVKNEARALFNAAQTHDAEELLKSSDAVGAVLSRSERNKVESFAGLVWEATGGRANAFPLRLEVKGLDDSALQFLLDSGPSLNSRFWRAIGEGLTLGRIIGLGARDTDNLGLLIEANIDRLRAGIALVASQERSIAEMAAPNARQGVDVSWSIRSGLLRLSSQDFDVYLTDSRTNAALPEPDDNPEPVSVEELRRRRHAQQVDAITVKAFDGTKITIEHDHIDPIDDEVLTEIGGARDLTVLSLRLSIEGKPLECDFETLSAYGRTTRRFSILDLITLAVPILTKVDDQFLQRFQTLSRVDQLKDPQLQLPFD